MFRSTGLSSRNIIVIDLVFRGGVGTVDLLQPVVLLGERRFGNIRRWSGRRILYFTRRGLMSLFRGSCLGTHCPRGSCLASLSLEAGASSSAACSAFQGRSPGTRIDSLPSKPRGVQFRTVPRQVKRQTTADGFRSSRQFSIEVSEMEQPDAAIWPETWR